MIDSADNINSDQIWRLSQINPAYQSLIRLSHAYGPDVLVYVVDQIPVDKFDHIDWSKQFVITDNITRSEAHYIGPEFFGTYRYDAQYVSRPPVRLLSCFINRACPFRQSWLYQLQRRQLLDQALVTYNLNYVLDDFKHLSGTQQLFDYLFHMDNETFFEEHQVLRAMVPFSTVSGTLEQAIIDSKISLVIETYFADNRAIAYSEKIFRQLQLPRPFLLFGCQHAVDGLRQLGFDVFDNVVDHSYDLNANALERQISILDQLQAFQSIQYDRATLQQFERQAAHNRDLLDRLKDRWPQKYRQLLSDIINYKASADSPT